MESASLKRAVHFCAQHAQIAWVVVQRVLVDVIHVLAVALADATFGSELTAGGVAASAAFLLLRLGVVVSVFLGVVSHIGGT